MVSSMTFVMTLLVVVVVEDEIEDLRGRRDRKLENKRCDVTTGRHGYQ